MLAVVGAKQVIYISKSVHNIMDGTSLTLKEAEKCDKYLQNNRRKDYPNRSN